MMRGITLLAFALALVASLSAQTTNTFFSTFDADRGNVVAPAHDGKLWLGGRKDERVLLLKLNPDGTILDRHSIGFEGAGLDLEHLTDLFEETDGTLVGCGNFEFDNLGRGFVFRYNPSSRQMLWAHIVHSGSIIYLHGITPKNGPDSDYVLYGNTQTTSGADKAELLQLDRATGQIASSQARSVQLGASGRYNQLISHDGALYACGHLTDGNGGFARVRHVVSKIDNTTFEPVWSRIGPVPGSTEARLEGRDLIVDDNALISTFSGSLNDPFWSTTRVFLQKNDFDGNLLWTRQYDLPEWYGEVAEDIINLPDGYLMYGQDLTSDTSRLFLLKTDKDGNIQWTRKIVYDYNDEFPDQPARSKILRLDDALFFTAQSQDNLGQTQGILVKTDLNGLVTDSCDYVQTAACFPVQLSAPVSETVTPAVSASTATQSAASVSIDQPELLYSKQCGATGTCPDLPDLQITLDSIVCTDGNPRLHYTVCNVGGQPYDGTSALFLYDQNPLTGPAHYITGSIGGGLPILPGQCSSLGSFGSDPYFQMPFELDTFTRLYALIGANFSVTTPIPLSGFPYPPNLAECNYLNNLDSIDVSPTLCGDCENPVTFIKKLGDPQRRELASSMCAAADGNVYIAGKQGNNPMIAKITTRGEPIWVRNFPPVNPNEPVEWASMIEDSDGKLVLCGTEGTSPSNRRAVVMRYDPLTGAVLWYKRYISNKPVGVSIVEKGPGGNFVLQSNYQILVGGNLSAQTQFVTLNRADGSTTGSEISYNTQNRNIVLANTVMNNGKLFAVGTWSTNMADVLQPFFVKFSPNNFLPEWANLTVSDTASGAARWMTPTDVAFDNDIAIITGTGWLNPLTPNESIFVFLEKHHPDGSIMWMKRYDMPMAPEEVLTLPNAYIVFGRMAGTNSFGMLKTDVHGNVLQARVLTAAPTAPISGGITARQNLILSLPQQILMLDHTWDTDDSDLVLMRTDLNFGLDNDCELMQDVQVQSQTLVASVEQALFGIGSNTPASPSVPANAVFQEDSLLLTTLCPTCTPDTLCTEKPDLGPDQILCSGEALALDAGAGFVSYNWSNGLTTQVIQASVSGDYVVQVTDTCGQTLSDTVKVTILSAPAPTTLSIDFYPGDTITIAGVNYTQSDTAVLVLSTAAGCDSLVTYILRLVVTQVELVCPPDQTVHIPSSQSSVSVAYPLPAAATDCPDPAIILTRLQGPPPGDLFSEGSTLVCYEAANQCNIRDTCCFTITVQKTVEETACDVKIPPGSCIRYELLGIQLDASGNPRYRMRLTNTCASPLKFAYFQLPDGMTATAPASGAVYSAPGGNTYEVRNPNLNPFWSTRFKRLTGDLNNGESDIFEYTLPKQAQPLFILVSAKLEDGSSSQAHINTFDCPVQPYVAPVQPSEIQERNSLEAVAKVSLRPNPTSGRLIVDISGTQYASCKIQVLNAQGQLVLEGEHIPGTALQLPDGLANGLYLLLVQPDDNSERAAVRFVLEH